ncbi:MAG TPA: hypothetical protein VNH83_20840 [Bryobacteraceae bacterium]|nr:hypothetical protein [Bryobacteraceae bacterium]
MKRAIRFIVGLYPARWRRRYGVEFDALLEDISPSLLDLFDVLQGALEMHVTIGTLGKSAAVFGAACALLAGGVSLTLPDVYRSLVLIHVRTAEGQPATLNAYRSQLTDVVEHALSQESLLAIMEKENLYQRERLNRPMDVVINKMRQDVRIVAKSTDAIEVSFDGPDAVRAQRITLDLVDKLVEDNLRRAPNYSGPVQLEVLDKPSMPQRPVRPNRAGITSLGLGAGILMGVLAVLVRRPTAEATA